MRPLRLLMVGFLIGGVQASACLGASLQKLDLVLDGSADPPGDRLDFTVLFAPGETKVEVSVRGYHISGDENENVTPIGEGTGELVQAVLTRHDASALTNGSIVIPYSTFALDQGTHRVAFEFVMKVDGRIVFVKPTPLSEVEITDETRREMTVAKTTVSQSVKERSTLVRLVPEGSDAASRKAEMKASTIETPVIEATTEKETVAVDIPGGFLRTRIPVNPDAASAPEPGVPESDVQSVSRTWWRSQDEVKSDRERRIWFATNRQLDADKPNTFNSKVSPDIQYGSCVVNIPVQNHRKGTVESPSWWTKLDPAKHFVINRTQRLDMGSFVKQFGDGDVLLFVHGYYNTFQDAIFRTAQLHHDLDFRGQSVAFSWPSAGSLSGYETDQKNADASVDALVETISTVVSTLKTVDDRQSRIHIMAHSMGNRILLQSLYKISEFEGDEFPKSAFGQVILAAPDVGAIMFNNLAPHAVSLSEQVTYYFCQTDAALHASRKVNQYEPVGLLPYFDDGLFTINANGVGTSFMGHGYYASSREVLSDVELMLKHGSSPPERMPPLGLETKVYGHSCWAFTEKKVAKKK